MIWADRIGIIWAIVVVGITLLVINLPIGMGDFGDLDHTLNFPWDKLGMFFVLPVWGFFRAIDFVANGPTHRRGRVKATILRP